MQQGVKSLVDRLISIHGEQGVCPTAGDWHAIFDTAGDGPIHILNLLKFKTQVDTPDGPVAGAAAYQKYASGVGPAFARVGGRRVFFGKVGHMFALGPVSDWDAAIVTLYPSAKALADMWLSDEFIAAHGNRTDGVERSQVLVCGNR